MYLYGADLLALFRTERYFSRPQCIAYIGNGSAFRYIIIPCSLYPSAPDCWQSANTLESLEYVGPINSRAAWELQQQQQLLLQPRSRDVLVPKTAVRNSINRAADG